MVRGGLAPADAFALLGSDIRLAILRALGDATLGLGDRTVAFSDLYDRVDVDDSAHFNYHLQQLLGSFVEKREDGYALLYPGRKVVRAVAAGTFNEHHELAFPVDGSCPHCGGDLVATYEDERLAVGCPDCDRALTANSFPPGGLDDRDPGEVARAFDRTVRSRVSLAVDGVCAECTGPMDGEVLTDLPDWGYDALPGFECERCRFWVAPSFGMMTLDLPEVRAFLRDHDDDPTRPYWDLPLCVTDRYTTVESRDPWRVTVAIERDDVALVVPIDDDLTVGEPSVEPTWV